MIDSCNRNIDYIRISLTDRCNLRCVYCMPEEGVELLPHEKILTYEEILRLCRCFAQLGIHKVKLTGGEPLVRRGVPWLVEQLKQIDGIDNVTITTNGILLTEQMEELHQAGIDGVNISLDTLDKEAFRQLTRFDSLDRVLRGIDKALEYPDVTTKINCVPLGGETAEQRRGNVEGHHFPCLRYYDSIREDSGKWSRRLLRAGGIYRENRVYQCGQPQVLPQMQPDSADIRGHVKKLSPVRRGSQFERRHE